MPPDHPPIGPPDAPNANPLTLDRSAVQEVLPHRDPFLFVDGVDALEPGVRVHGFVTIPRNHPYALDGDNVPGGLIIEAMAQVGGLMMLHEERESRPIALFHSVENFVMERTAPFGQRIELTAEAGTVRRRFVSVTAEAHQTGARIASATLRFFVLPASSAAPPTT